MMTPMISNPLRILINVSLLAKKENEKGNWMEITSLLRAGKVMVALQ